MGITHWGQSCNTSLDCSINSPYINFKKNQMQCGINKQLLIKLDKNETMDWKNWCKLIKDVQMVSTIFNQLVTTLLGSFPAQNW